jgi:hypothetical protein
MKGYKLPRDKGGRSVPAYPGSIGSGSDSPGGYQKEARANKPSGAGTKVGRPKRNSSVM